MRAIAQNAAYGFDFGTSNTAVARHAAGRARLLALQADRTSMPTAIFFSFEDGRPYFGRDAIERYLSGDEGRLMRSLKSILGGALYDEMTYIRSRRVSFSEILTHFIAYVRQIAAPVDRIVMGRPVHFVDDDPQADALAQEQLRRSAVDAGFVHVEFQFEPIAAALDYEQSVTAEELALVIDIGGGTSDFSIVRVSPERAKRPDRQSDILAFTGVHIGGTDFDRLLSLASLMPHLGFGSRLKTKNMNPPSWYYHDLSTWQRINRLYDPKVMTEIVGIRRESEAPEKLDRLMRVIELRKGHELLAQIEQAKIELSNVESTKIASIAFARGQLLRVSRERFERAVGDAMHRIERKIGDTVAIAGLKPNEISTVFVTGGSSSIPMLRTLIARALPRCRIVAGDAFGSVATGLAIDARRRF